MDILVEKWKWLYYNKKKQRENRDGGCKRSA